ncbi:MAG TPA: hypothetical protein VFZ08_08155 [Terriglobia bacterium]|nr:hypothetical protein [Terriglobia bacterium]
MRRRTFLKIAGTVAAEEIARVNAAAQSSSAAPQGSLGTRLSERSWILANESQKLVFTQRENRLEFQSFVRNDQDAWTPGALPGNRLIFGPSFDFQLKVATRSNYSGNAALFLAGTSRATGKQSKPVEYSWKAQITSATNSPWLRFEVTLQLPEALILQQRTAIEPQIILWLSSTSTLMEGQALSWRRVLLSQPTRNSLGAYGNDLPAVYLLDGNSHIETMMFFEMDKMGWMSYQNIPRFLAYRCSTISRLEGKRGQRWGVGLVADDASGNILPAGEVRFAFQISQRWLPRLVDEREAIHRWMDALLPLFEERLEWPPCATTWKEYAAGMVHDIEQKGSAQVEVNGHTGLRAYVRETSQLWKQPKNNFELMTLTDVLWPALLYQRLHPSEDLRILLSSLTENLPGFYVPNLDTLSNDFRHAATERVDSWYFFENGLVKYPTIAMLTDQKDLQQNFLHAFSYAEKLADRCANLFPIYYQSGDLQKEGAGTNYAVGGLFAWSGLLAERLSGNPRFRDVSKKALNVLGNVPPARLFHEPQELAFGALAAAALGQNEIARYLIYEQLRMFYWYSDPSQRSHDIRGMVQACASILYPAFKENVESILPWTGIMKQGLMIEGLLRFMDQMRRNNFYFFQRCQPGGAGTSASYIPFENLGTLELAGMTGNVGKEIYGSGEVLWMYLMFEALGKVDDWELMLVNLDLLDIFDLQAFPPHDLNFVLFNPTGLDRSAVLSIPIAQREPVRWTSDGKPISDTIRIPAHQHLRLKAEY